jgi:polysaccharide biosynthesis protein PslF
MRIAHVSTFPPLRCGIAIFASDLVQALSTVTNFKYALHYGENLTSTAFGQANVTVRSELTNLGIAISQSECDVICIQHEFGIWGGTHGEYLLDFLQQAKRPVVSVLHTTSTKGTDRHVRTDILRTIAHKSAATIVLTNRSREALCHLLQLPEESIGVIPHGIPDIEFVPLEFGSDRILRLVSFGFFRPDKGIEVVLEALHLARQRGLAFQYKIAGSPQPQFPEQLEYFQRIRRQIRDLCLADSVELNGKYLTREEQLHSIQQADAAIFAYQEAEHASSGAVALTLAAGRPALCTPFEFALSAAAETEAVYLSRDFTSAALSELILTFASGATDWEKAGRRAFDRTRAWTWSNVSQEFLRILQRSVSESTAGAIAGNARPEIRTGSEG